MKTKRHYAIPTFSDFCLRSFSLPDAVKQLLLNRIPNLAVTNRFPLKKLRP
ncbi:MAG: hypothetical protein ACLTWN_01005 [Blautia producta]